MKRVLEFLWSLWNWNAGPRAISTAGSFLVLGATFDTEAALLKVSKNGNLIGAFSYTGNSSLCAAVGQVTDLGLLVGGRIYGGVGGVWEDLNLTATSPAGSWAPLSIGVTNLTGPTQSVEGTLTVILNGVADIGGGIADSFVCLAPVP